MKTRFGSFSVLVVTIMFGLSTLAFPQTQTKSTAPGTAKTEQKAEMKTTKDSSSKTMKKAPLTHVKHKKIEKHAAGEKKTDKKLQ